jgi:hypothetical protein
MRCVTGHRYNTQTPWALSLFDECRWSQREIALELGMTRRTVEGCVRRPAFRARLEQLAHARTMRWEAERKARLAALRANEKRETAEMGAQAARWMKICNAAMHAQVQHRRLPECMRRYEG